MLKRGHQCARKRVKVCISEAKYHTQKRARNQGQKRKQNVQAEQKQNPTENSSKTKSAQRQKCMKTEAKSN
jgi:hypothetical protein